MDLQDNQGLTWEERSDGVYLSVPKNPLNKINLKQLKNDLDSQRIMNYNWKRIHEVITASRGFPEFIGPPFAYYDSQKDGHIILKAVPAFVTLAISSKSLSQKLVITPKDIEYRLSQLGVRHGVNWPIISSIIKKRQFNEALVVAKQTPPVHGKDAKIEEKVSIDPDARPIHKADGSVDYKNIKNIQQIQEGTIIAIKHPPMPGKAGLDVFGTPIQPEDGSDVPLPAGKNTKISPDGKQLIAAADGYLYRENEVICIGELLTIPNDVDFKSGNIKYSGDAIIFGNVLGGFTVDVKGDIQIEGSVDSSEIISRNGDIVIKKGVFGKKKAKITAFRHVSITMAQDTVINCEGTLEVKKSLRNCQVVAGNIKFRQGSVISGCQLTSFQAIIGYDMGVAGTRNYLTILDKEIEKKSEKITELIKLEEKIMEALVPMEKRIKGMHSMFKRSKAEASPKMKQEMKQALSQYYATKQKLDYIKVKKSDFIEAKERPKSLPGIIILHGKIQPDTRINMYGDRWDNPNLIRNMKFIWSPEGIITQPATKEKGEHHGIQTA